MNIEILDEISSLSSKEEIRDYLNNKNINYDENDVDNAFKLITKKGELSNDELNSVSGGCTVEYNEPKFKVGEIVSPRVGYEAEIIEVSSETKKYNYNLLYYYICHYYTIRKIDYDGTVHSELDYDVPEYELKKIY